MAAFAAPITATKAATAVATPVALGRPAAVPHALPGATAPRSAGSILPAAAAVLGGAALVTASVSRRRQRATGAARRAREPTRVTMLATDVLEKEEVETETASDTKAKEEVETETASDTKAKVAVPKTKAKAAPKPKAKAAAKAAPEPKAKAAAKKPKKEPEPLISQVFTGPWSPLITLGYWSVGEAFTKQVRSKGIVIHTKVIDAFCTTFNMSSKRKQNWIKLAKKTGHDQMGMLVDGGHFGDDGILGLGPVAMDFWTESGLAKWKP